MKRIINLLTALVMTVSLVGVIPVVNVCGETANPTTGLSTTVPPTTVVKPSLVTRPTSIKPTTPKKRTVTKEKTTIKATDKATKTITKAQAREIMKNAKIKKLKVASRDNKILANWKCIKKVTGYKIQVSKTKNFKKIVKTINIKNPKEKIVDGDVTYIYNNSTIGTMIKKKLPTGKSYYIRVRPYIKYKIKKGTKKAYGAWKKSKRIKIIKSSIKTSWWVTDQWKTYTYIDINNNYWDSDGFFCKYDKLLKEHGFTKDEIRLILSKI